MHKNLGSRVSPAERYPANDTNPLNLIWVMPA